jgi:hypothetical protein
VVLARLLTFWRADDSAAIGVSEASTTGAAVEIAGRSRSWASNRDEESSSAAPGTLGIERGGSVEELNGNLVGNQRKLIRL